MKRRQLFQSAVAGLLTGTRKEGTHHSYPGLLPLAPNRFERFHEMPIFQTPLQTFGFYTALWIHPAAFLFESAREIRRVNAMSAGNSHWGVS